MWTAILLLERKGKTAKVKHNGCFPICLTNWSETSGTNQRKIERQCSIETKFPTELIINFGYFSVK